MCRFTTLLFLFTLATNTVCGQTSDALAVVNQGIAAMGGENVLKNVTGLRLELLGHEFILDAFVRDDGPKPVEYDTIEELRDHGSGRLRRTKSVRIATETGGRSMTFVVSDSAAAIKISGPDGSERVVPGRLFDVDDARETLALSPERILFTAGKARDLRLHADTLLDGLTMNHLSFGWEGQQIQMYLDKVSHLIYQVETRGARTKDFSWRMWNEVIQRTTYYYWSVQEGGIQYPLQWDITRNELPYQSRMATRLEVDPDLEDETFVISDEIRSAFETRAAMGDPPIQEMEEIAPGIVPFQSWFRTVAIEQDDGIVLIDAPVAPGITRDLVAAVQKRFPEKRIKAAVIAAQAWTQFGGIAALAEAGIPVYGAAYHRDIFEAMVVSYTGSEYWDFRPVDDPITLGSGTNSIMLLPVPAANTRGFVLTYFPGHKLLYGSSEVLPGNMSSTSSRSLLDINATLQSQNLKVENVFSMFLPVTPWDQFFGQLE